MTTRLSAKKIGIHVIEAYPPSNPNRNEAGAPKSTVFGGVDRRMMSSQTQKRQVRLWFNQHSSEAKETHRSKHIARILFEGIQKKYPKVKDSEVVNLSNIILLASSLTSVGNATKKINKAHAATSKATATNSASAESNDSDEDIELEGIAYDGTNNPLFTADYQLLYSGNLIDELIAVSGNIIGDDFDISKLGASVKITKNKEPKPKDNVFKVDLSIKDKILWEVFSASILETMTQDKTISIGCFGRMSANNPQLNVDAAASVGFALGITRARHQSDFYTASDDFGQGASMLGRALYDSPTFYRHATFDIGVLEQYLSDGEDDQEDTLKDVDSRIVPGATDFINGFINARPTGWSKASASDVMTKFALVTVGDVSKNLVTAFTKVVSEDNAVEEGINRLISEYQGANRIYGQPDAAYFVSFTDVNFEGAEAVDSLSQLINDISEKLNEQ